MFLASHTAKYSADACACFLQGPGEEVEEYDVLMEIETESLTEEAYKVDEFAGKVTLLVEAQVVTSMFAPGRHKDQC